jgi:predicted aconitase
MSAEKYIDDALKGEYGEAAMIAAKVLVATGKASRSKGFIKISSAHISGINYHNIGDAGLELLRDISKVARFSVPTSINPCGAPVLETDKTFSKELVEKQKAIYDAFIKMGAKNSCTCVPYEGLNVPKRGEHVSWAESSAVVYGNSVLGIYTNKEGGLSALASAILGFTPYYGMHVDENRKPKKIIQLHFQINGNVRYGALGYFIGKFTKDIVGIIGIASAKKGELKALSASIGTYGSQPMFVIEPRTDEAEIVPLEKNQLDEAVSELSDEAEPQAIVLGCPFLSAEEVKMLAELVRGKRFDIPTYLFIDRTSFNELSQEEKETLHASGAKLYFDVCPSLSYLPETFGYTNVVSNSAKHYFYTKHQSNVKVKLMDVEEIVDKHVKK